LNQAGIKERFMSERLTICTDDHTDESLVQAAQEYLLEGLTATHVAELFKALSDPTRIRIIGLLAHTEMCVGDLHLVLGMTQPAVSHQLRILRSMRIVTARKEGRHVFYTLADEHVHDIFQQGLAHVQHD
jgi:DNA-binding transcriptional ArsR family regulator